MSDEEKDVYFIYSPLQMDRIKDANALMGNKAPIFGKVIVNGVYKIYTDIVSSIDNLAFADTKVVAKGKLSAMHYTEPSF